MEIKKLTLSHFGPYNQKITIDFTNYENSLFLISGPTGAGKTTIFDAICYGFYGRTSIKEKDVTEIKSKYATDNDLCFVEIEFYIKNKQYTIKRIPAQKALGQKKIKKINNTVHLASDTYSETNIKEVNKKIEELLNLTFEQFSQIVLLPQGQFKKLLFSSTEEKEKIFRTLFNTEILTYLSDKISENLKIHTDKITNIQKLIDHTLQDIPNLDITNPIETTIQLLNDTAEKIEIKKNRQKQELIQLQNEKNRLKRQAELRSEQSNIKQKLLELEHYPIVEKSQLLKKYHAYQIILPDIKQLTYLINTKNDKINKIENQVHLKEELQQLINNNEKKLEKINNQAQAIKEKEKLVNTYLSLLPSWEIYEFKQKELSQIQTELEKIIIKPITDLEKELQITKEKLINYTNKKNILNQKQAQYYNLIQIKESLVSLDIINQYKKNQKKYNETQQTLVNLEILENKQQTIYNNYRKKYIQSLAQELADTLEENKPCPVCGSLTHPNIYHDNIENFSKETLTSYHTQLSNTQIEINKNIAILQTLEQSLNQYDENELLSLEQKHNDLTKQIHTLKVELENIDTIISTMHTLEIAIKKQTEIIETTKQLNKDNEIKYTKLQQQFTYLSNDIHNLKTSLIFDTKNTMETQITALNNEISQYMLAIEQIKQEKNNLLQKQAITINQIELFHNELISLDTDIKKLEHTLQVYKQQHNLFDITYDEITHQNLKKEVDLIKNQKTQLKLRLDELNHYITDELINIDIIDDNIEKTTIIHETLITEFNTYNSKLATLKKLNESNKQALKQYHFFQELADVATGNNKKNANISFERYVLSLYLDNILKFANTRFLEMSEDRYLLQRNTEYIKGNMKKGLELNIYDNYNGTIRSVQTLSGGESFQASLALALGLSDYLQQFSGNNYTNMLFVDEGFGSLDSESLDIAINSLEKLQESGKMIGIISHVEELKNRIPNKIIIEKTKYGSKLNTN